MVGRAQSMRLRASRVLHSALVTAVQQMAILLPATVRGSSAELICSWDSVGLRAVVLEHPPPYPHISVTRRAL